MQLGTERELRDVSARRIQMFWRSHQNRKLFRKLMRTLRSAEHCVSPAVLVQISPLEAALLRDRSLHCKVRLRFSGSEFPPVIVFKIFHTGRGRSYLSGKKLLKPSSQAAVDSCRMMGSRKFMDLLMEDEVQWQGREISDPVDVTCMRDYVQYSSHLDGLPACVGGRENGWRRLSLQVPCRNRVRGPELDVLQREGVSGPSGQTETLRLPSDPPVLRSPTAPPPSAASSRRSARARSAAARKKRLYIHPDQRVLGDGQEDNLSEGEPCLVHLMEEDCEWEEEAEKLCCWTKQLTLDTLDQLDHI